MIGGKVNSNLQAIVPVAVIDANGAEQEFDARVQSINLQVGFRDRYLLPLRSSGGQ